MEQNKGRYLYGVAAGNLATTLGPIGIKGSNIYTIPQGEFCAIVHQCPSQPYESTDETTVSNWVIAHQAVLDEAKKRFGAVIPMGFDTIIHASDETVSPDDVVKDWLKNDDERLTAIMKKIKGRDEYGVQIFYEPDLMIGQIVEQSQEIQKLKGEIATRPPGMAYIYRQKLEKAIKIELENMAGDWFKEHYAILSNYCDDIVIGNTKSKGEKAMLLNCSCLVARERVNGLGAELEKINSKAGFSVRFTGPWPAYSFVSKFSISNGVTAK